MRFAYAALAVLFAGSISAPSLAQANWPLRDGRTIFACINTEAMPGAVANAVACGPDAERTIADAYCADIGRASATGWDTIFISSIQPESRYSFRLKTFPNGTTRWVRFDDEQFIFSRIDCR